MDVVFCVVGREVLCVIVDCCLGDFLSFVVSVDKVKWVFGWEFW